MVLRVDGDVLRLVAHHGPMPAGDIALHRGTVGGRTVIERRVIHVRDVQTEVDEFPEGSAIGRARGQRTTLSCPLLKANVAIGNIQARRNEVRSFSDQQISLLRTFADQAVIAIENTRLFEAEQMRTKELEESLEYQTATADVLNIISRSPHDLQPVFDGIVKTAMRLCDSYDAAFILKAGDKLKVRAHVGPIPILSDWPAGQRGWVVSRTVLEGKSLHIHDLSIESAEFPEGRAAALIYGHRTILTMPIMRAGEAIGLISVRRTEVRPFAERQVQLLQTFADQAVIAIENARLFEAEQASKRELQESLQQQTATAEVLKVISRAAFDLKAVLDSQQAPHCRGRHKRNCDSRSRTIDASPTRPSQRSSGNSAKVRGRSTSSSNTSIDLRQARSCDPLISPR